MPVCRTLFALLLVASFSLGGELQTLSGKVLIGDMVSLSEKEVVFKPSAAGQAAVTVPVADILQIELQREGTLPGSLKFADLELVDGSVLHWAKYTIKAKDVEITLAGSDVKVKVPLTAIASILNDVHDAAGRKDWQDKVVSKRGNQDMVGIKLNDVLNGLEGTLGDAGNAKGELAFEYELGGERRKRDLDPQCAQGLLFLRSLPADAPSPLCKVFDMHQSVYVASKLAMAGDKFVITTVSGPIFEFSRKAVARLITATIKLCSFRT